MRIAGEETSRSITFGAFAKGVVVRIGKDARVIPFPNATLYPFGDSGK